MKLPFVIFVAFAWLVASGASLFAQTAPDLSGHWTGALQAQGQQLVFEIDFIRTQSGDVAGAVSMPVQHIRNLPLHVAVDGRSIQFYARRDQVFRGEVAPDGASMSGEFAADSMTLAYTLTRTGDSTFEGPARSPAVTQALEGFWNGAVESDGRSRSVTLSIENHPDGTSTGTIVNVDQGGLELPVTITERAAQVTLTVTVLDASFAGALTETGVLTGAWKEGERSIPVIFRRAK
jgi:hypothetical protein